MKLFKIDGERVFQVSASIFKLEKDIQSLVEKNLLEIFNLKFVKTELSIKSFRIDTLGFDSENKSFVIIEYKKDARFKHICFFSYFTPFLLKTWTETWTGILKIN